mgnify:FL=1
MHSPTGADYPNETDFIEVVRPERIVFKHLGPAHEYWMTMTFADRSGKTELIWKMVSEATPENLKKKNFIVQANEQNFDRLEACLPNVRL